ncbi:MAG: CpaF family protein [Actinomycetales bacterium]|jgi:pilus assembly protein CpaF|uniref:CpaF family protein n=1 Tax=Candidatus Phosphoribacter hodrii TaxID=2953743 RepID=A0A934X5M3_9MICO|nr:CpaF family protein [Candidatus Phosphoribacter hodrii]MBP8837693.1 CpaF family protein [Dermatophilaceae bacterium]MBK7273895.1 CpaF family protein [Candidatus Phosphoribacter hodrii]MBL0004218.1 CpaF family protein [Candidatus Phosphoribacter hodrii]HNV15494.1 ATPase, T2SS/T4P/T4SS family [Dermatophilaceae bacterium]
MADAVRQVEGEVRELIRRSGLDPARHPMEIDRLVRDAVTDYDERSMRSGMPPLADLAGAAKSILDTVAGYGPLQRYFDDPKVEEIWVNSPDRVFIARAGQSELTNTILTADEVRDLVERMLRSSGRRVDLSSPFVDATLPDGSRLHVVIPDITRDHWHINVRKFVVRADHLDDLVRLGTLTRPAATFLEAAVVSGLNILVAGGTQAGKTTLLGCLASAIPARERVVTCEEVFELKIPLRDVAGMQCRQPSLEGTGAVPLRRLVTEALRMRPSRIIVGEVRQAESLDLLIALNSGLPGMCTLHANSAREAITKMCTLPLLAGENVSPRFVVPTVASSVDLVVHIALEGDGTRRVREIVAVPGRVEGDVVEVADIFTTRGGVLKRADGFPPHVDRFERAGYRLTALLAQEA